MKNLICLLSGLTSLACCCAAAMADPLVHSEREGAAGLDRFGADTYAGKPLVGDFHPNESLLKLPLKPSRAYEKRRESMQSGPNDLIKDGVVIKGYPNYEKKKLDVLLGADENCKKDEMQDQGNLPKFFPLEKTRHHADLYPK